ncbi:hypothetical protein Pelo_1642 [Pelomyxa schiedti]|nr:hypothetical protein Pelo_1642 [Pelomyxa schiedti]
MSGMLFASALTVSPNNIFFSPQPPPPAPSTSPPPPQPQHQGGGRTSSSPPPPPPQGCGLRWSLSASLAASSASSSPSLLPPSVQGRRWCGVRAALGGLAPAQQDLGGGELAGEGYKLLCEMTRMPSLMAAVMDMSFEDSYLKRCEEERREEENRAARLAELLNAQLLLQQEQQKALLLAQEQAQKYAEQREQQQAQMQAEQQTRLQAEQQARMLAEQKAQQARMIMDQQTQLVQSHWEQRQIEQQKEQWWREFEKRPEVKPVPLLPTQVSPFVAELLANKLSQVAIVAAIKAHNETENAVVYAFAFQHLESLGYDPVSISLAMNASNSNVDAAENSLKAQVAEIQRMFGSVATMYFAQWMLHVAQGERSVVESLKISFDELVGMGFDHRKVLVALLQAKGNNKVALETLCNH